MNHQKKRKHAGFTLVEMAIVIVIFGLLLSALLIPLQAQRNVAFQRQTETSLENAKQALLGFAQAHGRLPCPATNNGTSVFPDDTGTSNPSGSGACFQQVGFLPATTLGILPADAQGFAMDAWNNRIRYAITNANTNAYTFTINDGMNNVGLSNLAPDLRVCATSTPAQCTPTINLTNEAVAVIYSLGATGAQASGGNDENANLDNNTVFVSHDPTAVGATNGEFDHIVTWISPYVLYNAMIQAGQLH
jgi:prepilin-type N-terminal cleavage/methylation domain-containing protein